MVPHLNLNKTFDKAIVVLLIEKEMVLLVAFVELFSKDIV